MADRGGFLNKSSGFGGGAMEDKDFDEKDVWGVVVAKERDDSGPKTIRVSKESSGSSSAWPLPAAPRKIPRAIALPSSNAQVVHGSSAPMDIPDWSKIYGKNCMKGSTAGVSNKGDCDYGDHYHDNGGDEDEDDGDDMIPPHEWIARRLARNQIPSFSVCEGMGRTLKGRDLSKVRNAILTKTGFIE